METGIKETKEVVRAVVELKKAIDAARADGKFDIKEDFVYFAPVALPVIAALEGVSNVPAELDGLDDNEAAELTAEFGNAWKAPAFQKIFKGCVLIAAGVFDLDDDKETDVTAQPNVDVA